MKKWTMKSLATVAISLSVGLLMQYAHGQEERSYQRCHTSFETAFMLNNTPADPNSNDDDFPTDNLNDPDQAILFKYM